MSWDNIIKKKKAMLSRTAWTKDRKSGLTQECMEAWRRWIKDVQEISELLISYEDAVKKINQLDANRPKTEYASNEDAIFEQDGAVIAKRSLKRKIIEILAELDVKAVDENELVMEEEPINEPVSLDSMSRSEAKRHVRVEAKRVYKEQLDEVSPLSVLLYTEQLDQAVDFLSGHGEKFPLLELRASTVDGDMHKIAMDITDTHRNKIAKFMTIEKQYIETLQAINEATTTEELKRILEGLNGH